MRVISGSARGRTLQAVPGSNTRPTTDKVKEALFSMIGPYFAGGLALDLFAGTGGLGIEALSRGMDRAIFVDTQAQSIPVIRRNLEATHLTEQAEVYRNDALRALKVLHKHERTFDLVFLDPPYRLAIIPECIHYLLAQDMIQDGAFIVCEHDQSLEFSDALRPLMLWKQAEYGDTTITIYRFEKEGGP
jgi:16S rRNA (guanine966-N2)-methyltransferase